jgi:hypothetical protein
MAPHRFRLILLVRIFVFRVFLECAFKTAGKITESHKGLWLLIQVAPKTLLAPTDIFIDLTRSLKGASNTYLKQAITRHYSAVMQLLGNEPIFCVLDEAQIPVNRFWDIFLSNAKPLQSRSILREIILTWRSFLPHLIISGTRVLMQVVETDLGSMVAKEGPGLRTITEMGGFDDKDHQRAYLEQYFPPDFLNTPDGKEIASRVGYWLRGRSVCNASV